MSPGVILVKPQGGSPSAPTRLDTFPYVSSAGTSNLIQFSGGGFPSQMSLAGTAMQLDVLERKPDGSSRTFRAIAPIVWPASPPGVPGSGTELVAIETDPGVASPMSGVYPGSSNPAAMEFTLSVARGAYVASVANAQTTEVLCGVGNVKGHAGPDYIRVTRYYCPFRAVNSNDHGTLHEWCGAMVVYITRRVDLDGFICEAMFANSALDTPHATYSGNTNKNPGFIVYSAISLNKGVGLPYTVLHADTFDQNNAPNAPEGTGPINGYLVSPFVGVKRHTSAPGTLPGWMFAVYNQAMSSTAVMSMLEGAGCALAFEGRGFSARSSYGFGVTNMRHTDPRDWVAVGNTQLSFQNERLRAEADAAVLRAQIRTGQGSGSGELLTGTRAGVWHCLGDLDPNNPGGQLIAGHGIRFTTSGMLPVWRLSAMMSSRRVNHAFYAWNEGRPLLPADCLTVEFDPSPDVNSNVTVSLLHHDDMDSGYSNRLPSCQFACVSPRGFDPSNPTNPAWPDPRYGSRHGFPYGPSTQRLLGSPLYS